MTDVVLLLLLAAATTGTATKTGRRAAVNFVRSAHKATGWRTPRRAAHHYAGQAGTLTGKATAFSARAGRRAAGQAGQRAVTIAGDRWQRRAESGEDRPFLRIVRPAGSAGNQDGASEPADGPAAGGETPGPGTAGPGSEPGGQDQAPADAPGTGTAPAPAPPAPAPAGARPKGRNMPARYAINLEPPSTDGEFLESCTQLGDVLKSLSEQISNWADGLGGLKLPQSVLNPLHQVSDGITEAAAGAAKSAKAFEDEFEDARGVAARGMHITGQDG